MPSPTNATCDHWFNGSASVTVLIVSALAKAVVRLSTWLVKFRTLVFPPTTKLKSCALLVCRYTQASAVTDWLLNGISPGSVAPALVRLRNAARPGAGPGTLKSCGPESGFGGLMRASSTESTRSNATRSPALNRSSARCTGWSSLRKV